MRKRWPFLWRLCLGLVHRSLCPTSLPEHLPHPACCDRAFFLAVQKQAPSDLICRLAKVDSENLGTCCNCVVGVMFVWQTEKTVGSPYRVLGIHSWVPGLVWNPWTSWGSSIITYLFCIKGETEVYHLLFILICTIGCYFENTMIQAFIFYRLLSFPCPHHSMETYIVKQIIKCGHAWG